MRGPIASEVSGRNGAVGSAAGAPRQVIMAGTGEVSWAWQQGGGVAATPFAQQP